MNLSLLVVDGKTTKRKVAPHLPAILGRSRQADITVAHPLVSRRHCELYDNGGLLMLRDLTSLNGTMIGGRRIGLAPLLPGDEFTIGPLTFQVLYEYHGDRESIPEITYLGEAEASTEAGPGHPAPHSGQPPTVNVDDNWPGQSSNDSLSGEIATPDLMALADADVDEVVPALALPPGFNRPNVARRPTADNPPRPQTTGNRTPAIDSSPRPGGPARESPWAVGSEELIKPAVQETPPTAQPPENRAPADDAEFGGFLDDLQ